MMVEFSRAMVYIGLAIVGCVLVGQFISLTLHIVFTRKAAQIFDELEQKEEFKGLCIELEKSVAERTEVFEKMVALAKSDFDEHFKKEEAAELERLLKAKYKLLRNKEQHRMACG